jgi:hypothetical protein
MSARYLIFYLRFVGVAALLAFAAALMPGSWMVEIAEWMDIEPFPDAPLTFYLARNLSLMYGFLGVFLMLIASDLPRYRPLVRWMAVSAVSFAVLQGVVNAMAGMPAMWTYGESGWNLLGGGLMWWLQARTFEDGGRE